MKKFTYENDYKYVKEQIDKQEKQIAKKAIKELSAVYPEMIKQRKKFITAGIAGLILLIASILLYPVALITFILKGFGPSAIMLLVSIVLMMISNKLSKNFKTYRDSFNQSFNDKTEDFTFSEELQFETHKLEQMNVFLENFITNEKFSFELEKERKEFEEDIVNLNKTTYLSKRIASIGAIVCIIIATYNANYTLAAVFAGVTFFYLLGVDMYKHINLKKLNNKLDELKQQ